jgi:hypothetical protein
MRRSSTEEEYDEHLPPFTEAYEAGLIINDDDDYMLDEYENLVNFSAAFQRALDCARENRQRPFKSKEGKKLYRRLTDAVSVGREGGYSDEAIGEDPGANARP